MPLEERCPASYALQALRAKERGMKIRPVLLTATLSILGCSGSSSTKETSTSATSSATAALTSTASSSASAKKEKHEKDKEARNDPSSSPVDASCAPSSAPCSGEATINSGGRDRTYRYHLPKPGGKPGLVVALHGHGGDAVGFEKVAHIVRLADEDGFVAIVPDGVEKAWADARGVSDASKANVDDVAFISALIDHGVKDLGADASKVMVLGFSNGSMMTQRIGCELADKLTGIVTISGELPTVEGPTCAPKKPISVIAFHGTKDPVVPYEGGEVKGAAGGSVLSAQASIARWAELDKCAAGKPTASEEPDTDPDDGTTTKRETYQGCANGTQVVFFSIKGGEHKYPVGPEKGEKKNDKDTKGQSHDVDALQMAWTLLFPSK